MYSSANTAPRNPVDADDDVFCLVGQVDGQRDDQQRNDCEREDEHRERRLAFEPI